MSFLSSKSWGLIYSLYLVLYKDTFAYNEWGYTTRFIAHIKIFSYISNLTFRIIIQLVHIEPVYVEKLAFMDSVDQDPHYSHITYTNLWPISGKLCKFW